MAMALPFLLCFLLACTLPICSICSSIALLHELFNHFVVHDFVHSGLTYTTFNFSGLVADTSAVPQAFSGRGTDLAKMNIDISVTVTNTGDRSGATVVFVLYSKQTRSVVRNLRDLAGFTKLDLAAGESRRVMVPVRLCDLARFDQKIPTTNRKGKTISGAYVVDGGTYSFFAGDCVASGGVYDDKSTCSHETAQKGVTATVGEPEKVFGVYL